MYLVAPNSAAFHNQKWNLAGMRGLGQLRGMNGMRGIGCACQKKLGQLGEVAGVPAGTILGYSATWPYRNTFSHGVSPNDVQSRIQVQLAQAYGIVIDSQSHQTSDYVSTASETGFVLQVHTTSDYGAPEDIQSIIDHAIYGDTNSMPHSTIRVVKMVAPAGGNPNATLPANVAASIAAAQAGYDDAVARGDTTSAAQFAAEIKRLSGQDPRGATGWLSDNWMYLAAGGVALVAVKELL